NRRREPLRERRVVGDVEAAVEVRALRDAALARSSIELAEEVVAARREDARAAAAGLRKSLAPEHAEECRGSGRCIVAVEGLRSAAARRADGVRIEISEADLLQVAAGMVDAREGRVQAWWRGNLPSRVHRAG